MDTEHTWKVAYLEAHEGYEIRYYVHLVDGKSTGNHKVSIYAPDNKLCHTIDENDVFLDLQSDAITWIDARIKQEAADLQAAAKERDELRLQEAEIADVLRQHGIAPGTLRSRVAVMAGRMVAAERQVRELRATLTAYRDDAA